MSYRVQIIKALSRLGANGTINPDAKDNQGAYLGPVYLWSVVQDIAENKKKEAWAALEKSKLIMSDDELRASIQGETVVTKTKTFALSARVDKPRESFDKSLFIDAAAKKFKIDKHKLIELAATCIKNSKAPLTKKVIEL